jgi:hypothetical protein
MFLVVSCDSTEFEPTATSNAVEQSAGDQVPPRPTAAANAEVIEATTESPSRWPEMTPCEAATAIVGAPFHGTVVTMLSARLDGETSGRPWTWAAIEPEVPGQSELWVAFQGGQLGTVMYSADHFVATGDRVVVFIGADQSPSLEVDAFIPASNAIARRTQDDDLETVYGTIASDDVAAWLALQGRHEHGGSCDVAWLR